MTKARWLILIFMVACVGAGMVFARRYPGRRNFERGRRDDLRRGVPDWTPDKEFSDDVFTFVRIRYSSGYGGGYYGGGYGRRGRGRGFSGGNWATDYPDSDLNFSFRLHQLTSMKVDPEGLILELTEPELFNYPFIYMLEVGRLVFSEEEVKCLRKYLLNGGFLMVDDFWGQVAWDNFYYEMKRVFPEKEPIPLKLDHPIFHCVFELKEKPQIPAIDWAVDRRTDTLTGMTSESGDPPIYYGIYDDKGRMMVIICRDTDLGDGWEREGESHAYFREFSEKKAYPLGINIVFYAMTH
jgi:hypothetical protein